VLFLFPVAILMCAATAVASLRSILLESRQAQRASGLAVAFCVLGLFAFILWVSRAPDIDSAIARLQGSDPEERIAAIHHLASIRDEQVVQPLIEELNESNPVIRAAAAKALGRTRDLRAVDPLVWALRDGNWQVRQNAAKALGRILAAAEMPASPKAMKELGAALNDDSATVRVAGAEALGRIGDERGVARLIPALDDQSALVRWHAQDALTAIVGRNLGPSPEAWRRWLESR
jgi:HEAT repeat protein